MKVPYGPDHASSVARRFETGVQPKGLPQLLRWFLASWSEEAPDRVHASSVWRDYVRWDEERQGVGGSLLGAPALADPFRRYLENSPRELDQDGNFRRPVHAAISTIERSRPVTARFLFVLACNGGDIAGVADRLNVAREIALGFAEWAIYHCWKVCRPAPQREAAA